MKIKQDAGFVHVDLQTRRDGNSAGLAAKDDNTMVYFGGLHAEVTLYDLRVCVTMNPDKGEWHNLEWARQQALNVILVPETITEVIVALCEIHHKHGKQEGRRELQHQLRDLLQVRS